MGSRLDTALTRNLDAQAHNDWQKLGIFNPSPEVDSLMERVWMLRDHGVAQQIVDELLADLAAIYRSNTQERRSERASAGAISHVLSGLGQRALGVKGFARAARPLLRNIDQPGAKGLMARRALGKLIDENPEPLKARSLAHELGDGAHERLIDYLGSAV